MKDYYHPNHRVHTRSVWQRFSKLIMYGIVLFIGAGFFLYVFPTATIVIIPKTTEVTGKFSVTLDATGKSTDPAVLPAIHFSKSFKRQQSAVATGTADIGTKARGTMTITNKVGVDWALTRQDILIGANNRQYVLEKDTVVPKALVNGEGTIEFGTIVAAVEAVESGEQYNLASGNALVITTLPDNRKDKVFGTVTEAIAGGTSVIVQAVSPDDVVQVEDRMSTEAFRESREEYQQSLGGEHIISESLMQFSRRATSTVPEVGEPAKEFTLVFEGEIGGIAPVRTRFLEVLKQQVIQNLSTVSPEQENIELHESAISYTFSQVHFSENGYVVTADVDYTVALAERLPLDEFKKNILGKKESEARLYLLSQDGVRDVRILFSWSILKEIPNDTGKISISVSTTEKE